MIIPPLTRHLAVCSAADVQRFLDFDRNFWDVISIRDVKSPRPRLTGSCEVLDLSFDDIETGDGSAASAAIKEPQVRAVWDFVDRSENAPLLVHCADGLSRSAAVAAAILVRALMAANGPVAELSARTVEGLLLVRPPASPNSLVLLRLLEAIMDSALAREITGAIRDDDPILHNRFVRPR